VERENWIDMPPKTPSCFSFSPRVIIIIIIAMEFFFLFFLSSSSLARLKMEQMMPAGDGRKCCFVSSS